ncbi:MAG: fibrillarin-like rRNA/tRNA 2'-O-methyltransferase [Candidatus Micrarchaeota archaeon]|nr:fibrillarin-like rRNA/tRNA 2'-O-methyltransferase [Candidatus Micrarchaeota archaeon]MCX8154587.1 fibrillarin-like rRNA/tRNA 2'-O-methyltransferase [Candidatus Micrarchaeota archaeon]
MILRRDSRLYTKNLVPGRTVYGEKLIYDNGVEYREWDPYRSKLAGAILRGLRTFSFREDSSVLYLGASTGTTVSHVSDICYRGQIYAVEISKRMMVKLLELAKVRENIIPILADANHPEIYQEIGKVDIIYQDIAQPNQSEIFLKNLRMFNPKTSYLCLKTQSIDVSEDPETILETELKRIKIDPKEIIQLDPFDRHHYFLVFEFDG